MTPTKLPIETLSREEFRKLLKACNRAYPSGLRDRALLAIFYGAGLRIAEALALRPRDVDVNECVVKVTSGKGDKRRTCAIEDGMCAIVREWVTYRSEKLGLNGTKPLFCQISAGKVGQAMSQAAVRGMLVRRTKRAGLDRRVHAHGLRHSHAANMAAEGLPLNLIQLQLGHANAATTSRYLAHVNPRDLIAAVRRMGKQLA